jgi:uncharacterized membrane protein YgaE (UPF0421/DUF939 family)
MSGVNLNYKAILFYGLLAGALIIAVLYFFKVQPIYTLIQPAIASISGAFKIDTSQGIGKLVSSNLPTIATVTGIAIPLLVATVKSRLDVAAKTKALETANELAALDAKAAKTTLQNAKSEKDKTILDLQDRINQYENDPALSQLQTNYSSLKDRETRLQGQIDLLQQKLEQEIQNRPIITKTIVK